MMATKGQRRRASVFITSIVPIISVISSCLAIGSTEASVASAPKTSHLFHSSHSAMSAVRGQPESFWLKVRAKNKFERSKIADMGVSIEFVSDDYVIAIGQRAHRDALAKKGLLIAGLDSWMVDFDFPAKDSNFHNYDEMSRELTDLVTRFPTLTKLDSIGRSSEGHDIWHLRLSKDVSTDTAQADARPGVIFMGGHHAREHLSIEIPLLFARHLLEAYVKGDPEITKLIDSRDIHIIPMVNPDGAEYDIADGRYKSWRKNRSQNGDGTRGVDLNRNYGYGWGTGGSSQDPSSEVYMGPAPFSEPEARAIRDFVEKQTNATTLLSFHTFSELILYPWGHVYDPIADGRDRAVFETMAKTMAKWNGYTPEQSSELYIASGDTTDWAYGEHKIFAFTFELDPSSIWDGGFYPGQAAIPVVFNKNLRPCLYLIEHADNPYRVLEPTQSNYGLRSPLVSDGIP